VAEEHADAPFDKLLREYGKVFQDFDDLTLARWQAQTLGQFEGKVWRSSHPLLRAYLLAAQVGDERQVWFKRLATPPREYPESACCRAPLLVMLTRDVMESGLVCMHCNGTAVAFEDIPVDLQPPVKSWATEYAPIHAVAHWEDRQRKITGNYEQALEEAAQAAEKLLATAGRRLAPRFLEYYPAIVWEDQDECLEVRPEDIFP
jgi:hypothetical protein